MASPEDVTNVSFGDFSPEALGKLVREMRTHRRDVRDPVSQQLADTLAHTFVAYLAYLLKAFGLIRPDGSVHVPEVVHEMWLEENETIEDAHLRLWNDRAKDWLIIESLPTYYVTMATFLEFFEVHKTRNPERILGVGSGPGVYETFIGAALQDFFKGHKFEITCTDFSRGMTGRNRQVIKRSRDFFHRRIKNVKAQTEDMMRLSGIERGSMDQIFCNNALQWASDWKRALDQFRRVINPNGLGILYLFVHKHPMSIRRADDGEPVRQTGAFEIEELLDELEARSFQVLRGRHIGGRRGTGQMGTEVNRMFIKAAYRKNGIEHSWRDAQVSTSMTGVSF